MKKINNNLAKLVKVMRDGEFHDGNALGETLNMTRSAVWKMIKKLEKYGVEINSVKGKGYALCEPLILLDAGQIQTGINHQDCAITLFESIDSTNEYLKNIRSKKMRVCVAEQQTSGKGRLNRSWYSPFAQNIYLSCLYPFTKDISELAGLSLVVSLAIASTLRSFGLNEKLFAKWPNDVLYDGSKLSGTLIEVQAESHGACHAVIGIGLNVNMLLDSSHEITQGWTSMRKITGEYLDRNAVVVKLINDLHDYLQRFSQHGFKDFISEWQHLDCMHGKEITLKNHNETISGIMSGINAQGHLLLKTAEGERSFSSGDTSVVKK